MDENSERWGNAFLVNFMSPIFVLLVFQIFCFLMVLNSFLYFGMALTYCPLTFPYSAYSQALDLKTRLGSNFFFFYLATVTLYYSFSSAL
jgi:hypothetical protein